MDGSPIDLGDDQIENIEYSFDPLELVKYLENSFTENDVWKQARMDIPRMDIKINKKYICKLRDLNLHRANPHYNLLVGVCTQAFVAFSYNILAKELPMGYGIIECPKQKPVMIAVASYKNYTRVAMVKVMRLADLQAKMDVKTLYKLKITCKFMLSKSSKCNSFGFINCERLYCLRSRK